MSDTPRTDKAEEKYQSWRVYASQYGHIPAAMEQAPKEADPFAIARDLERELAAVTTERDELKHEVAFRRDDSVALADARERIRYLEMDLAEKQRPLDAEMARLNENLIAANEAALISSMDRDRMRPVVEAAQRWRHSNFAGDESELTSAIDTYEAAK